MIPYWRNRKIDMVLCKKCFYGLEEWLSKGNYVQNKINDEEKSCASFAKAKKRYINQDTTKSASANQA